MQIKLFIVTIIFILSQFTGIAGTKRTSISKQEIILRTSAGTIRAWISGEKKRIILKSDRVYCGYYMNRLYCKQGELQGKPLNGKYSRYDLNENIIESGQFKYGLKEGLWKNLSSGGILTETSEYRKGILCGEQVIYKNGKPDIMEKYRNGKLIRKPKSLNTTILPQVENDKSVKKKNLFQRLIKSKNPKTKIESIPKKQKIGNATKAPGH